MHARTRTWLTTLMAGGGLLLLAGCDPTARTTVLGGLQSAANNVATALISAFFQSLRAQDEEHVVQAILDQLPVILA